MTDSPTRPADEAMEACGSCGGRGKIPAASITPETAWRDCPECRPTPAIPDEAIDAARRAYNIARDGGRGDQHAAMRAALDAAIRASPAPDAMREARVIMRAGRCGRHFDESCRCCRAAIECTDAEIYRLHDEVNALRTDGGSDD